MDKIKIQIKEIILNIVGNGFGNLYQEMKSYIYR